MNLEELKQDAESLIRSGQLQRARQLLARLKHNQLPRSRACEFATLTRRAGLPALALKIMAPVIRPKVPLDSPATDEEKSVYAVALLALGAMPEALEILATANGADPNILLSTAFAHMKRWDYASAVPTLKTYLKTVGISDYGLMIGRVNLAASYVALSDAKNAKPLLNEILQTTRENAWTLLHKNALELSSQMAIQENDWDSAEKSLKKASENSDHSFNLDDLYLDKWRAIMAVYKSGGNPQAVENLAGVRERAVKNNHWETLRDCDYHLALAKRDQQLALFVYFGTQHARFRERLVSAASSWFVIPDLYIRQMTKVEADRVLDLDRGDELNSNVSMKAGKSLHAALRALLSDFYRPHQIGSLHSSVFPGEYFNPESSPKRITFLIHRLRNWFSENEIPLRVTVGPDGISLSGDSPYAFRISAGRHISSAPTVNAYDVLLAKAREHFGTKRFAASQLAKSLEISERSARYFIKQALGEKRIAKSGTGRATVYKFGR